MPYKDNAPYTKKKAHQRILDAAVVSFQTLGYARTTTQVIAENANVAEVTIFRQFGNKQKLFRAAVTQIGKAAELERIEVQLSGDLQADLRLISQQMLAFFLTQKDAIRMLMFEATHFPEMKEALAQNPGEQFQILTRYFQGQIENGHMRNIHPQILAQTFISMHFGYAIGLELIKEQLPIDILLEETAEQFVRIFLEGTATIDNPSKQGEEK